MCAMESSSLVKDYNPVTPAAFARGYIVYCSFGHPHLVCRPEHIPDDPMLPHPIYAFRSGRVFAEQFLHDLDPWRNSQFIISTLFDYLHITSFGSGYKPVTSQLNEVAEALVDERLVMFELWDIAEHPNVVKQQLQKSDKTRSSDAAGSSAPKRSSGADLASPEKKAPPKPGIGAIPVTSGGSSKPSQDPKTPKALEAKKATASKKKTISDKQGKNEATWTVDEQGRPLSVEATLCETHTGCTRSSQEQSHQQQVGGESRASDDDGGHLVGHRFLKDQGLKNLFPQNSNLNRSAYKKMENEWADWTKEGFKVKLKVTLLPPGAERPTDILCEYEVFDSESEERVYKKDHRFNNKRGEKFDRVDKKKMKTYKRNS
ncbi:hypothetical protein CWC05_09975 [Pseudoalteromonas ruthenica]|uniref:Type VII secretion system protein EssD-like domain-containing protein n=2 Tax=Pseudoalteromonas ruthenica TaxID=151081 RepID=A0A5S3Z454_9GAMM|nr:hypothetical protein CWC05_09975 [Pseudoalteromonas ruthenica]